MSKPNSNISIIGCLDLSIYKCISDDISTDEVIITDERIQHIKERHPNDYEKYQTYLRESVEHPDYIVEAKRPKTAYILKEVTDQETNRKLKTILRLKTSEDKEGYKNSVITFMKINDKEWGRLLRNKKILYRRRDI